MTPTRLRECIATLGWSQRELSAICEFPDESAVRNMARGKTRIWQDLEGWLERLVAFQAEVEFPIGLLWWSVDVAGQFLAAIERAPPAVAEWLQAIASFFEVNRWPTDTWRFSIETSERAAQLTADAGELGIPIYGDLARVLSLDIETAKVWQRQPQTIPEVLADWLSRMAEYKKVTGFPINLFLLYGYLTEDFERAAVSDADGPRWARDAVNFYRSMPAPDGFAPAREVFIREGTMADGMPQPPAVDAFTAPKARPNYRYDRGQQPRDWLDQSRLPGELGEEWLNTGFPIGIFWWSRSYVADFTRAAGRSSPEVSRWLLSACDFYADHRAYDDHWRMGDDDECYAAEVTADLATLAIGIYGDLGRALRLEMRTARAWQRRPGTTHFHIADWAHELAEFKRETGFPIELFCLNWWLTTTFAAACAAPSQPPEAYEWVRRALAFFDAHPTPEGIDRPPP